LGLIRYAKAIAVACREVNSFFPAAVSRMDAARLPAPNPNFGPLATA